jgi:hypothetical protein
MTLSELFSFCFTNRILNQGFSLSKASKIHALDIQHEQGFGFEASRATVLTDSTASTLLELSAMVITGLDSLSYPTVFLLTN